MGWRGVSDVPAQQELSNIRRRKLGNDDLHHFPQAGLVRGLPISWLRRWRDRGQGVQRLPGSFQHPGPVMPFDVIFVHGIIGIVGQALSFELVESGVIPGFERLHLALSLGQSLLQTQAAEGRPDAEDLHLVLGGGGSGRCDPELPAQALYLPS